MAKWYAADVPEIGGLDKNRSSVSRMDIFILSKHDVILHERLLT
jgi:hypothetical protein